MSPFSLNALAGLAPLVSLFFAASDFTQVNAQGQTGLIPLVDRRVTWGNIPYQVTGANGGIRGPQLGYNQCNSTTEGPTSLCQTLIFNAIDDFCLWSTNQLEGNPDVVGDSEAREVAWCTRKGHGTRIIPWGAISGVQWLYAKNYIQVVGFIDQTKINLRGDDSGGELDPHGADQQGNPLGGIVFSKGLGFTANTFQQHIQANNTLPDSGYVQVIEWTNFMGNNAFCVKMCNPNSPQDLQRHLCEHIYDRIGCAYNAPANYAAINGSYTVCDSDDMTPVGQYEVSPGVTSTWFQGPEGVVPTPPYTPVIPQSSNCHTYSAEQIFGAAPTTSTTAMTTAAGATQTGASVSRSGATGPSATNTASASTRRADMNFLPFASLAVVLSAFVGGAAVLL